MYNIHVYIAWCRDVLTYMYMYVYRFLSRGSRRCQMPPWLWSTPLDKMHIVHVHVYTCIYSTCPQSLSFHLPPLSKKLKETLVYVYMT